MFRLNIYRNPIKLILEVNVYSGFADIKHSTYILDWESVEMWATIFFIIIASISSWIFRFIAGIFEAIIIFPLFGLKDDSIAESLERRPKFFISVVIFKNTVIGTANAFMIFINTAAFILNSNLNHWFLFSLGVVWSLFIISTGKILPGVFFWTSTVNFLALWFGLGWFAVVAIGVMTFFISLAYYHSKIDELQREYLGANYE